MVKSMSIKLEFVAPLPQIAITRFTYNAVEFYGPQGPRYKEVDLYFLYPKFQACIHLLLLYSPVCVGPGRKPRRPVFSERGSIPLDSIVK